MRKFSVKVDGFSIQVSVSHSTVLYLLTIHSDA